MATIGDSLMVLDKLVFKEKRLEYGEFIKILENNFAGNEELRQEILSFTKFGNDTVWTNIQPLRETFSLMRQTE